MSNEDIRQRAAIAVLPECVRETHEVLSNGGKLTEETQAKQAAMMAVAYADELAEKLSNVGQNGKDCKPANFAKSCKDLQELTEFEQELYNFMQQAQVEKRLEDADVLAEFVRKYSFVLLEKSYKQFKQDQLNQEFATFTRQEFNDAVDDEVKRRCEEINVDEMFDKVPPYIFKTDFDFYKKGVVDTINKLKK